MANHLSRHLSSGARRRRPGSSAGLQLTELLFTGVIFLILSGVFLRSTASSLRREELNAIAVDLYGWLETVHRETMSRNELSGGGPCPVTFSTGTALRPGAVLARTPAGCAPGSPRVGSDEVFRLPNTNTGSTFTVQSFNGTAVTYSPRGTTTLTVPLTLEFSRQGTNVARCLRISPVLGILSIGGANNVSNTAALDCPDASFDDTF